VTDQLPDPLVPAEVDLRDFGFMPLEVVRLRDSDLAALSTGDEFKAAVLLWAACWHQQPPASLPNDDRLLAKYSQAKNWKKVREGALRGFVLCSDRRLYHPVIAERALNAWTEKLAQRARTKAATEAREAKRRLQQTPTDVARNEPRDDDRDVQRDVARDVVQGIGRVKGEGIEEKETRALAAPEKPEPAPPTPNGHAQEPTPAGLVCRAMKQVGLMAVNPGDPRLLELLRQGATIEEFVGVAAEAVSKGKGWAWVLTVVEKRRAEAAAIALAPPVPASAPSQAADRTADYLREQFKPLSAEEKAKADAARKRAMAGVHRGTP